MKKCPKCKEEIEDGATKCKHCGTDLRNWFVRHKILTGLFVLIILIIIISSAENKNTNSTTSTNSTTKTVSSSNSGKTTTVAVRKVTGTAVTLGAGTFTGGKDVAAGLYDVTPGAGQSGNFVVTGTDSYDEILGNAGAAGGVPKVRVQISNGDQIQISSLSSVTFTPVTTPFSTAYSATSLYTGTFTVGQDIGAGRYLVTPGAGQSGNFIVSGTDSYDEILGNAGAAGGVPSLTVTLTNGDVISIGSLSQVNFAPTK